MSDKRDRVLAALRAEDVAAHYQIGGIWRGRWLRARRCPTADHGTDALGLSRDGKWHCHACDAGGDLIRFIAAAENLDPRADFPRVLEIAAGIAGVELEDDDFGGAPAKPAPPPRPPAPPVVPLADRVHVARKRARWLWDHLREPGKWAEEYLRGRGLDLAACRLRDELKAGPLVVDSRDASEELRRLLKMWALPGIALGVRSIEDGELVDVRIRRFEPREDQPKIVGMLGGVTREGDRLIGCYGRRPHQIGLETPLVILVEGLADYLTACTVWPDAQVLGAVDAGSMPLLAAYVAHEIAQWPDDRKMVIVEQWDGVKVGRDGITREGAAAVSVNAAAKRAAVTIGPARVGWIGCEPHKDLNDRYRAGADLAPVWES